MPQNFHVMGLGHVGIHVRDLERSKAFYRDILGFHIVWERDCSDGSHLLFMGNGSCVIELMQTDAQLADGHLDHLTLLVSNLANAQKELKAKGIVFETETFNDDRELYQNGETNLLFRGPDNERLQIEQIM